MDEAWIWTLVEKKKKNRPFDSASLCSLRPLSSARSLWPFVLGYSFSVLSNPNLPRGCCIKLSCLTLYRTLFVCLFFRIVLISTCSLGEKKIWINIYLLWKTWLRHIRWLPEEKFLIMSNFVHIVVFSSLSLGILFYSYAVIQKRDRNYPSSYQLGSKCRLTQVMILIAFNPYRNYIKLKWVG